MAIGTNPRYLEELAVGGGYGDPENGGADFEKNGDISTDGNVTLKGVLSAGSTPQALTDANGEIDGSKIQSGTVDASKMDGTGDYTVNDLTATGDLAVAGVSTLTGLEVTDSTDLGSDVVVNGTMELDSDWPDKGAPTTNERSSEQTHGGTYSRKIVAGSTFLGIQQDLGTLSKGDTYLLTFWVYRVSGNVRSRVQGNTTFWLVGNADRSPALNTWVQETLLFTVPDTEGASVQLIAGSTAGTFYIDDAVLKQVGGDVTVRGQLEARQGVIAGGSMTVEGALDVSGGAATVGIAGTTRGVLALEDGAGGTAPGSLKLHSPNGTVWHVFVEDDGTVKVHSALPTQNADGSVIGAQT